jgi:hypothetical protein
LQVGAAALLPHTLLAGVEGVYEHSKLLSENQEKHHLLILRDVFFNAVEGGPLHRLNNLAYVYMEKASMSAHLRSAMPIIPASL